MMDVMIDLETFGTTPGCAIRSIGAVSFELNEDRTHIEQCFSANIDTHSCLYARLHIDADTHAWWRRQAPEAIAALEVDKRPLLEVVSNFEKWFAKVNPRSVWCQGANFDVVLWEAAARAVGRGVPWKYYAVRDTRTLYDLAGFDPRSLVRNGVYHCALDDARHQVECCRRAWAKLKGV